MKNIFFISYSEERDDVDRLDEEVLMTQIRVWAHWLDKELQISPSDVRESRLENLSLRINLYQKKFDKEKPDFKWAKGVEEHYKKALHIREAYSYERKGKEHIDIPEEEFDRLITTRRSIRNFTEEKISNSLVMKILTYGNWAPTNCNQQSLRYFVIKSPEIKDRLKLGSLSGRMSPCLIAIIADMRFYSDGDIECPSHDSGAAIQNILLASHYYGLGTCYTSSQITNSPQNRELLCVRDYEKITAVILLGYYKMSPITPVRRRIEEVVRYI